MEIVIAIGIALGLMAFAYFYFRRRRQNVQTNETDRTQIMPPSMRPKRPSSTKRK